MVRILRVKELEIRKRALVIESELHRRTMLLEIDNIRVSVALRKRKYDHVKSAAGIIGIAAPVAGLLFALRRSHKNDAPGGKGSNGLISKLVLGAQMLGRLKPLWRGFMEGRRAAKATREERNGEVGE